MDPLTLDRIDLARIDLDRIDLAQPAPLAAARRPAPVDLGARFVAFLMVGLMLAGSASLAQALCSYNRLTIAAAAATAEPFAAPAMAAGVMEPPIELTAVHAKLLPCEELVAASL
ncbi:hypothetical protein KHC28_12375 [Ancylobacter sonchi]|uniref:hypothetical protein n=1 Tax=Ancylobacter sonchi TaxID=1937790 RepID=UPI001BD2D44D|nr:hypothetical protein [Ancylobacter sonchi]MBS7534451.1 hypothetical protein [Ancylobacter sonchi]